MFYFEFTVSLSQLRVNQTNQIFQIYKSYMACVIWGECGNHVMINKYKRNIFQSKHNCPLKYFKYS